MCTPYDVVKGAQHHAEVSGVRLNKDDCRSFVYSSCPETLAKTVNSGDCVE